MNIFVLDNDVDKNVSYYVDRHVIKMSTELCQMLSTNYILCNRENNYPSFLYKVTHRNHPCTIWLRESKENFKYGIKLANAIISEYDYRYSKPDKYVRARQIIKFLNSIELPLESKGLTTFALAMPEEYRCADVVKSYRIYYNNEKRHLFNWKNRNKPYWIKKDY